MIIIDPSNKHNLKMSHCVLKTLLSLKVTVSKILVLGLFSQFYYAARLLTRTRKFDHITPILASLHWLRINARSDFKDLIIPYCPSRPLRPSGAGLLSIPKVKKKSARHSIFFLSALSVEQSATCNQRSW
ncbi:hypothetical protein N1851_019873 [Merluccius polli]|uniref:Uncharacterized protein n=1 Tax=Merluccius polli TaxID=89951 RepID=A0AA47MLS5_MERPO|nr:hypothetical protein N1851_019873 [Merluccius polli]